MATKLIAYDARLNPGDKPSKKSRKIRESLLVETRISLYQTAMNNTGRNFQGKKIAAKKMAEFSTELYKLALKDIESIGQLNIKQIEKIIKQPPVKKKTKKASVKNLMNKIKNGRGGKKKKGGKR